MNRSAITIPSLSSGLRLAVLAAMPFSALFGASIATPMVVQYREILSSGTYADWITIFIVLAVLMGCSLLPTTWVAIVSGYFLGWSALLPMIVAYSLAALIGRELGHLILTETTRNVFLEKPRIRDFVERAQDHSGSFVVFARLSPLLPFGITNVALGTLPMSILHYLSFSVLGMLPRTTLAIVGGKYAKELITSFTGPENGAATVILCVISILGLYYCLRKKAD